MSFGISLKSFSRGSICTHLEMRSGNRMLKIIKMGFHNLNCCYIEVVDSG